VWDKKGSARVLPPLPNDTGARADGINGRGEVVGSSFIDAGDSTAVVWDRDGTPRALPPLPSYPFSAAYGINKDDEVVGSSHRPGDPVEVTAVVWR